MKAIKKTDIVIAAVIIIVAAATFFALPALRQAGKTLVITQNNQIIGTYRIDKDRTVKLDGNTVVIKGGKVKMSTADCPRGICRHHAAISRKGESIICLPHKVILEVK